MKFFLDNCLSKYYAAGLRGFATLQNHEIVHLTDNDRFPPDTPDPVWLDALGREGGWIVLSGDDRITRNPANRRAWQESGLTAFFFAPPFNSAAFWTQAADIVRWFPDIVQVARRAPQGHGFILQAKSKEPRQIYPPLDTPKRR